MKHLERFEADPINYTPGGPEKKAPLKLDDSLGVDFLTYCRDVKKNSVLWLSKQKRYVEWWRQKLHGVDLRRVSLTDHIMPALKGTKAEAHRIATIKAIYAWLRKEQHIISPAEDPTFGTLAVPQSDPNARIIKDKAITREHYRAARQELEGHWRAAVDLQAGTGWHITEVQRFAADGSVEPYPGKKMKGVAGVLVCPETKAGGSLRTAVGPETLAAGKSLLERGSLDPTKYRLAVKVACKAAGIPVFTPGRLRHSVATWAINNGADPATVSAFLNHKNPRTTRKFYATHAVPTKVPTLL